MIDVANGYVDKLIFVKNINFDVSPLSFNVSYRVSNICLLICELFMLLMC